MVSNKVRFWRHLRVLRTVLALAALIFATAIPSGLAASGNSPIRFDAIIGYSGVMPQNAWFPVMCELQNTGPTLTGIIEISNDQLSKGQSRQLKIELPANTLKRVTIPVFASARYIQWNIRLLDTRGRLIAEPNYIGSKSVSGTPLLGVLPRVASGMPSLPQIKSRNPEIQPVAVRLQPEFFPDNPLVLDGLPMIYISSERVMGMTVPQVNALLAWMQHGGHLVIGVDNPGDLTASEWLNKILPCELSNSETVQSHGEFQQFIHDYTINPDEDNPEEGSTVGTSVQRRRGGANARPSVSLPAVRNQNNSSNNELVEDSTFENTPLPVLTGKLRDGKVILSNGSIPLVIQAQRGQGKITVLTFSPEREPFASWKNRGWFWAKLGGVPSRLYKSNEFEQYNGRFATDGVVGAMIDSRQVRKLPLGFLLLLLAAYLVVIGPLDQYWLKKINKQMLTWITFPLYVVGFSALIYFIGFYLRNGDLEYNELSIVDVLPNNQLGVAEQPLAERTSTVNGDSAVFRGQTYCSIYSPVNSSYPLESEQPFAALRGEFMNYGGGQSTRAAVEQHGNAFKAEAFVPVWSSQLFVSDWLQPSAMPFEISVTPGEKLWKLSVVNKTDRTYPQTYLALMGRIFELGKLPAHKTNNVILNTEQGVLLTDFARFHQIDLLSAAEGRSTSFGNNNTYIDNLAVGSVSLSFSSLLNPASSQRNQFQNSLSAPRGLDLGDLLQRDQGVFFAYDEDHSFAPPLNRFTSRRLHRNTLLRVVLPMKQRSMSN